MRRERRDRERFVKFTTAYTTAAVAAAAAADAVYRYRFFFLWNRKKQPSRVAIRMKNRRPVGGINRRGVVKPRRK